MGALLTTFIAALLAELGDKTQLLAIALAARYRKPGAVLAGIAVAALANALIAAAGGGLIHDMINPRATTLLIAFALAAAGISGLLRQKNAGDMGSTWRTGAFVTSAACFFLLEFGDKTQFTTFALAAYHNALLLAAAGAAAGVVAANIPAVVLAKEMHKLIALKKIRLGVSMLFLLAGLVLAVTALRLT